MKGSNVKRMWIIGLVVVVILGIIFIPKIFFSEGDNLVKFKVLEEKEIPQKIQEVLPRLKYQEGAASCKLGDEIYVIVTRGEKNTGGYSVSIDKIEKVKMDDTFNLTIHAVFKDPGADQVVPQVITYPYTVVKTELNEQPSKIKLEATYAE